MEFINLTLSGIANGAVYGAVALALVLIWRATRIVNFAQGALLMFTTYLSAAMISGGAPYWVAVIGGVGAGFVIGALIELVLIRRVEQAPPLNAVIVTLGLLVFVEALAGMIWSNTPRSYPAAFSIQGFKVGATRIFFSPDDAFIVGMVAAVALLLALLFRRTNLGLKLRAAAFAPEVARLLGVKVGRMFTFGWALAAAVGALAGALVAPSTFLGPNSFDPILVFAFVAAVLGGLDSPLGAIVGGLLVGLVLSYVSGYEGQALSPLAALGLLLITLMVRPTGLFAATKERRV